jgi:Vanadium chloroperoxidase N-terminal domain
MDPILYWNAVALEANKTDFSRPMAGKPGEFEAPEQGGPTLSSRALAIVHLAMYDAYAGVANDPANLPPYLPGLPAPGAGASAEAAVAYAAHETLAQLFPSQKTTFDQALAGAGLSGGGVQAGRDFGLLVARTILEDRKNDVKNAGSAHPVTGVKYAAKDARGGHREDPDHPGQGFHAPFYGAFTKCFAVSKRHELDKPPALDSTEYVKALREVRAKGIAPELMGTLDEPTRTPDETVIGVYWAYDGAVNLGTPPRLYNRIVRVLAEARNNTPAENARLFALVNAAMADAGILAWDQKYIHDLWRPVVGIREHDKSMGPAATGGNDNLSGDCDPFWLPLGAPKSNELKKNFTPPFPAYPSGHATFGAAALHITRLFYGVTSHDSDRLFHGLTFVSEELDGKNRDNKGAVRPRHVRNFDNGLWQMIEENGRSRVNLGVHWVFDAFVLDHFRRPDLSRNIGGVPLGITIAEDIFNGGRGKGLKKSPVGPRP